MKPIILVICVCFIGILPTMAAKPKLGEVIKAGKSNVLIRTIRHSPPFSDHPSSITDREAIEEGGWGAAIIYRFQILDPAFHISDALTKHLAESYHLTDPGNQRVPVKSSNPVDVVAEVGIENGFILDVTNEAWFTISHVRHPKYYTLCYEVSVALIDASTKKVVRKGSMKWQSNGNPYATRADNRAAIFRGELEEAGETAIKFFISTAFSEKG